MRQASRAAGVAVALLLAARLPAATRVSIPGQSVAPGGSAVIPVTYSSDDGRVSAIQFDLTYESAAIGMGATIGEAARGSGKSFQLADLGPGRKRFLLAGLNRTSIAPGVLVNLFLDVSFGAPPGQYILKLSNLVGADAGG
ncbi:MAG: hypothetical protein LAQ30_05465, partial [Acidobacteriia bacterium]|nr:hypothetical protein [Terriglobia bacterium]